MQIHADVIGRIERKQCSMHMGLSLVLFFISTSLRVGPFRCSRITSSLCSYSLKSLLFAGSKNDETHITSGYMSLGLLLQLWLSPLPA